MFIRDYGSCPVDEDICTPEELDANIISTMVGNIRGAIDRFAQFKKDTGHPLKITALNKYVFAPQGNTFKNIDRIPPTWGSFTKNDFKVHHYSKKCSSDSLIRGVIEGLLKPPRNQELQPMILCFVTNDPEFASIAAYLKLENQNDIILVHNSAQNTVTSLVRKHFSWNSVQDIPKNRKAGVAEKKGTKSTKEKKQEKSKEKVEKGEKSASAKDNKGDRDNGRGGRARDLEPGEELEEGEEGEDGQGLLVIPPGKELVPWTAGDAEASGMFAFGIEDDPDLSRNKKQQQKNAAASTKKEEKEISKALSASGDSGSVDGRHGAGQHQGEGHVLKHDLKFSSVATYIKRLMHWRKALEEASGEPSRNYLMGEDTSDYDDDLSLVCSVRVDMNPKIKKFTLYIRGPSLELVEKRFQRVKAMVDECIKVRQLHNFTGWSAEHRNALIGSEVLAAQEKATRACVLFHYSGSTTVAEIVALRPVMHNALLKFVQKLKPKETKLEIPYAFVCWYDEDLWEKMRSCFAIKTEVIGENGKPIKLKTGYISPEEADSMVTLKIWGFNPKFLDRAIEHIQLNDEREEINVVLWVDDASANAAAAAMAQAALPVKSNAASTAASAAAKDKADKAEKAAAGRTVIVAPPAATSAPVMKDEPVTAPKKGSAATADSTAPAPKGSKEKLVPEEGSGASAHKAVYTFADREAGLYFFTFEAAFREYLDRTFGVFVDEAEHAAQLHLMNTAVDFKVDTLKVALYGTSIKNVQAARAYMDQFNTNVLGRYQIFFPRVSARKYKEIFNKKAVQLQKMQNLRIKETAVDITVPKADQPAFDPLKTPGFVNIRSRPQMVLNGKVNFPTDITITVCGSLISDNTKAVLDQNKAAFNSIPSEFSTATVVIPPTHHMKQALTLKAEREELIKRFGLVSLRWEEGSRASGNISTAKIWAYTKASLKTMLNEVLRQDMGGGHAHLLEDEKEEVPLPAQPPHVQQAQVHAPLHPQAHHPAHANMPNRFDMPAPAPAGAKAIMGHGHGFVEHHPVGPGGVPSYAAPAPLHSHPGGVNAAASTAAMLAGNAKLFASAKGAIRPAVPMPPAPPAVELVPHTKKVIYLPDLSLRFIMQGDPLKTKLNDVLEGLLKSGAHIAYPYKDRTDPHACFELDGEFNCVAKAATVLNEFIEKATRSVRCVQVVVNTEQFLYLTAGGEGLLTGSNVTVQELQTKCGVHCIFNPPPTSLRDAFSIFDFRFSSDILKKDMFEFALGDLDLNSALLPSAPRGKADQEMLSVNVFNCYSQRNVEIDIISSNSSESGWTWGVSNLLLLVGSNTLGFNPMEVDQLNRGDVLVHADSKTGKTILRIKPNSQTRGINYQAAVLTNALLKCLQKANELGLKGLAISAPTDIDAFPELTPELIRSLTVEAVVEFSKKCRSYLRFSKLVCIELGYNAATVASLLEESATPSIPAAMAALERRIEPAQKDRMVRTMTVLLERQEAENVEVALQSSYDARNPYQPPRPDVRSKVTLHTCNVPLPVSLFPALTAYERPKGFRTFLVKGLLSSVVKAVDEIKTKLTTPKVLEPDLSFKVADFF